MFRFEPRHTTCVRKQIFVEDFIEMMDGLLKCWQSWIEYVPILNKLIITYNNNINNNNLYFYP